METKQHAKDLVPCTTFVNPEATQRIHKRRSNYTSSNAFVFLCQIAKKSRIFGAGGLVRTGFDCCIVWIFCVSHDVLVGGERRQSRCSHPPNGDYAGLSRTRRLLLPAILCKGDFGRLGVGGEMETVHAVGQRFLVRVHITVHITPQKVRGLVFFLTVVRAIGQTVQISCRP